MQNHFVHGDSVMGHLSLEDVKLGVLEHKILLICSSASACGGRMRQGAYIKDSISHWDANVCTLARSTHARALTIFPGASGTRSLAQCYLNKQTAKAPALLAVGNEDIVVSTLRKVVWFGSAPDRWL